MSIKCDTDDTIKKLTEIYGAKLMAFEKLVTSPDGLHEISSYVCDHFDNGGGALKFVITESNGNGKVGMLRLWRKWMSITADFMAANGVTMPLMLDKDGKPYGKRPFNANDAHELFTSQWLGLDQSGKRLSWVMSEGDNVADKGQRFIAMMRHQNWCIEKGISLPKPRNSEFSELEQQQNQ